MATRRSDPKPSTRRTRQGDALAAAFQRAGRPLSPKEALALGQRHVPELSLATVYRWLKRSVAEGELVPVDLPGESSRYELAAAAAKHHHHFRCGTCDRVFDLHGCAPGVEGLAPRGFTGEDHEVVLYGTCKDCRPTG